MSDANSTSRLRSTSFQATLTRGFLGRLRGMLQDGIINEESCGKDGKDGERRGRFFHCT